jgi:hypothetical protein
MVTAFAFSVCQVRTDDCPGWITSGLAAKVAVGVGGGGSGGGVTFATFLLQPASRKVTAKAEIKGSFVTAFFMNLSSNEKWGFE